MAWTKCSQSGSWSGGNPETLKVKNAFKLSILFFKEIDSIKNSKHSCKLNLQGCNLF
jgi:hypothetical protein